MAKNYSVAFNLFGKDKASGPIGRVRGALSSLRGQASATSRAMSMHRVGDGFRNLSAAIGRVRSQISGMGFGLTALFGGATAAGLIGMINGSANAADGLAKMGRQVGMTARQLAGYHYAMELAGGGTAADFNTAIRTFAKNIGDAANGTGRAAPILKAMGVSLTDSTGRVRNTNDLLAELAGKLSRIEDPLQRQAVAQRLFGESGAKMALVLGDGAEALAKLTKEGREASGMTEQLAADSEIYNDEVTRMGQAFTKIRNGFAAKLLPIMTPLVTKFREFITAVSPAIIEKFSVAVGNLAQSLTAWFSAADGGVSRAELALDSFMAGVSATGQAIAKVADVLGGWHNLLIGVALFMAAPMISSMLGVIGAFARLGVAIAATTTKMAGFMLVAQGRSFGVLLSGIRKGIGLTRAFNLAWRMNPIGMIITGVQLLVGLGVVLYNNFEPFRKLIDGIAETILSFANFLTGGFAGRALQAIGINVSGDASSNAPVSPTDMPLPETGSSASSIQRFVQAPASAPSVPVAAAQSNGQVVVRFENAPPGLRVQQIRSENMSLSAAVDVGTDYTGLD